MDATAPSADGAAQADQAWHHAQKLRKHLMKQLEKIQGESASGVDIAQFEAVESVLEKFRLACVSIIFFDFDSAVANSAEHALWTLHTSINTEYRRLLGRLKNNSQAVERRKVEKMYNNFLRIAQKFYKGYIQRLSARYDVQELKRVARGIDTEQMAAADMISPVPAELSSKVLKSCHSTLIRLGDLARYRIQARHKKSGYDSALTFYSLAHDLIPDSGFGFHQMGIINLEEGNHLDVVYHFYRSWAVEDPHPNAKQNLEAELNRLQLPDTPAARNRSAAPHDAFSMWFVRLHALFYKGEVSAKHGELEGEVLHRLEMAAKNVNPSDALFKMALINMSAYHIASTKFKEKPGPKASHFCQYTLRFNVRFILTICGVLEAELKETISQRREAGRESNDGAQSQTVEILLPILRTYTSWLAARRSEIFEAANTLGPVVFDMLQSLASVFTLLCVETYYKKNLSNLSTCPYLLPEDLAMRGLRPLKDDQVPEACRYQCKDEGGLKPHLQSQKQRLDPHVESLARIFDILRGAYYLVEDPVVPLGYRLLEDWLVFEYQPNGPDPASSAARVGPNPVGEIQEAQGQSLDTPLRAQREPVLENAKPAARPENDANQPKSPLVTNINGQVGCHVDDAEQTVINMLAPFLKPLTPPHPRSLDEPSYGIHTATANEIFAQAEPSPKGSPPSRKMEPLPWNWVYTPTPRKTHDLVSSAGREAFSHHHESKQSPKGSISGATMPEDPFATAGGYHTGRADPQAQANLGSPSGRDTHRNHLLQSFANTSAHAHSPRVPTHSDWNQNSYAQRHPDVPATSPPWVARGFDNPPISTDTSNFSHMSSMYHGTPANFGGRSAANYEGRQAPQQLPSPRDQRSATRQFRMDETTSSYDAAILQAAFYSNK